MKTFRPVYDYALFVLGFVTAAALFCYTGALIKGADTTGLKDFALIALGALGGYARRDSTSNTLQLIDSVRQPVAASPVLPEVEAPEKPPAPRKRVAKKESE